MTEPKPTYRKRAPGGGRKVKWGKWGRQVRINANFPALVELVLVSEYGSVQKAIDALVIQPIVDRDNQKSVPNDTTESSQI